MLLLHKILLFIYFLIIILFLLLTTVVMLIFFVNPHASDDPNGFEFFKFYYLIFVEKWNEFVRWEEEFGND